MISIEQEHDRKIATITLEEYGHKAGCAVYIYNDKIDEAYLSSLQVSPELQLQGLGTKLLSLGEDYAAKNKAKSICLLVQTDSWMHLWYSRCGYTDLMLHKTRSKYMWMIKQIKET